MVNESWTGGTWQQYCNLCRTYYYGFHTCNNTYTNVWPTQVWTTCLECSAYYIQGTVHTCAQALEAKPKYGEHTLECGCEVKTIVVKHCETLHKEPDDSESS